MIKPCCFVVRMCVVYFSFSCFVVSNGDGNLGWGNLVYGLSMLDLVVRNKDLIN